MFGIRRPTGARTFWRHILRRPGRWTASAEPSIGIRHVPCGVVWHPSENGRSVSLREAPAASAIWCVVQAAGGLPREASAASACPDWRPLARIFTGRGIRDTSTCAPVLTCGVPVEGSAYGASRPLVAGGAFSVFDGEQDVGGFDHCGHRRANLEPEVSDGFDRDRRDQAQAVNVQLHVGDRLTRG